MSAHFLHRIKRRIRSLPARARRSRGLSRLASSGELGAAVAAAVRASTVSAPDGTSAAIEAMRAEFASRPDPLVDGSLGEPGIYDVGTVADAVKASRKPRDAAMLGRLVAQFRPKVVVELGTNVGVSAAYMAAATTGKVVTFDSSAYRQRLAGELHRACGVNNVEYVQGLFSDTVEPKLAQLPPVDLAFIDGHHQYQPTLDYFEAIHRHAAKRCVYIFDDIDWSDGMRAAWARIKADPRFALVADMTNMGVCVTAEDGRQPAYVSDPINLTV